MPPRRHADEAYALGGQTAAESYTQHGGHPRCDQPVGATAVHPATGFFSETPTSPGAVTEAGVTWIGPRRGHRAMGDKVTSRAPPPPPTWPVSPGRRPVTKPEEVLASRGAGLPRRLKAAFGGGGGACGWYATQPRWSRPWNRPTGGAGLLRAVGDYVERYWSGPAHRVQTSATRTAAASISRARLLGAGRHQKLIEESPAPG